MLKSCISIVCVLAASLSATHALSQDLSGWSDKTVCRLAASQQDDPQYLQEAKNRGLSCAESAAMQASTSASTALSGKSNKLVPNTLKKIKIVKNWEPVANFEALRQYAINEYEFRNVDKFNANYACKNRMEKMDPYPGTGKDTGKGSDDNTVKFFTCQARYHDLATKKPQIIGDVLLSWASNSKDPLVVIDDPKLGFQTAGYQLPSLLGTFTQFYALWYDEIYYTPEERKLVDSYLTKTLMRQTFPVLSKSYKGPNKRCDINNIKSIFHDRTGTNNCGNIRTKVAVGEIMLGLRLENQTLLDKGHDDIYVVFAFINEDGINLHHASKGANTVNYSWDYTHYMTILAELYAELGYDFLEHTLPHGAKVHEYLSFNYRLLKDFTLTKEWAKYNVGNVASPYKQIRNLTQEQFEANPYYGDGGSYSYKHGDYEFVKTHTRFVERYMPDLYAQYSTQEIRRFTKSRWMIGTNRGISPYMLYLGNTSSDNVAMTEIQKQEARAKRVKSPEDIKTAARAERIERREMLYALDGEYNVQFTLENTGSKPQDLGQIVLTLDKAQPKFDTTNTLYDDLGLDGAILSLDYDGSLKIRGVVNLGHPYGEGCINLVGNITSEIAFKDTPYEMCKNSIQILQVKFKKMGAMKAYGQ